MMKLNPKQMKYADMAGDYLLVAGGINWLTAEFFGLNLVTELVKLVGGQPLVGQIIYGLVGAAAVFKLLKLTNMLK